MRILVRGSEHLQEGGNEMHLDFFINSKEEGDMYKKRLDSMVLCEPKRMVVDIVAYESTGII